MPKKTIFINFFLIGTLFASVNNIQKSTNDDIVFLKTEGNLYPIKEKNFLVEAEEEYNKSKQQIYHNIVNKITSSIAKQATAKGTLKICNKISKRVSYNTFTMPTDIINPNGRIVFKKGEKKIINTPTPFLIVFLAYNKQQPKAFVKELKYYFDISKKLKVQTTFFTNKGNVLYLRKKYKKYKIDFAPSNKYIENIFKISCYPTMQYYYKNKKIEFTKKYNDFLKDK